MSASRMSFAATMMASGVRERRGLHMVAGVHYPADVSGRYRLHPDRRGLVILSEAEVTRIERNRGLMLCLWGVLLTDRYGEKRLSPQVYYTRAYATDYAQSMRRMGFAKGARAIKLVATPVKEVK